jgi:hypothetical protein
MFDIVIEGVAVPDAFEREPGGGWNELIEPRIGSVIHV